MDCGLPADTSTPARPVARCGGAVDDTDARPQGVGQTAGHRTRSCPSRTSPAT